jgi:hypothetical protein
MTVGFVDICGGSIVNWTDIQDGPFAIDNGSTGRSRHDTRRPTRRFEQPERRRPDRRRRTGLRRGTRHRPLVHCRVPGHRHRTRAWIAVL